MRTFEAVWTTLGLDALTPQQRTLRVSETIRRDTVLAIDAQATAPTLAVASSSNGVEATIAAVGRGEVAMATLPRLSVRGLDRGTDATDATDNDVDALRRDIAVTGLLGEGGMGRVLLGYQRSLRREVALKTVYPNATWEARSAVLSEGFITGHLEHPNIIPVHELGLDGSGMPLLVMKRVIGFEWSELLADPNHAAWKRIPAFAMKRPDDRLGAHIEILMQVAQALAYAHGRGVIHRDLKPENVMIGESGEVYLVDWGVATMLETKEPHALVGTPAYLAPEMIDEELPVGPWTDVYLLGATLHAVLMGRPRHDGTELRTVLTSAYQSKPCIYPPSVPEELAELCNRATARDPDKRPSSALEFHRALTSFVAHTGSLALADAANERLTELESVLAEPAHDDARAARLATECRFGYLMALRDWPENPRARIGLRRALERVLEMEIARENAPAARAALAELKETVSRDSPESDGIPARLTEGVQRVETSFANRMRDREELAKVHHDQDVTVSARQRNLLLTAITGLIILSTASFMLRRGLYAESIDPAVSITAFASLTLLLAVAGVVFGRRWLLKNAINRQFASTLIISLVLLVVHRALGLIAGADISSTLRSDMFIAALSSAVLGAHGTRAWFVPTSIMIVAAIASGLYPPQTHVIWAASSIAFFFSVAMVWRRAAATPGPV